jgi:hypothetical protein
LKFAGSEGLKGLDLSHVSADDEYKLRVQLAGGCESILPMWLTAGRAMGHSTGQEL